MAQQNVEIVQAHFNAWNARDLDALEAMYDPLVIVRATADWPEPGPFVGKEAVIRQGEQLRDTWDAVVVEPTGDFIANGDRVAVRHVWRAIGHGPESSNLEFTMVYTIRNAKILAIDYFWDHAEALETVGLSG